MKSTLNQFPIILPAETWDPIQRHGAEVRKIGS